MPGIFWGIRRIKTTKVLKMAQRIASVAVLIWLAMYSAVFGQSWVQVEAHPTLREAQARAQAYSGALPDVAGFRLRSGWFALALGPYTETQAQARLRDLRGGGIIPSDSYISDSRPYRQQFWPVGGAQTQPVTTAPAAAPLPVPASDETPRQARRSEGLLSRDEREDLQIALQWFGFYDAAIDGSFGRGTRRSMAAWQSANLFEETGILTTNQRQVLLAKYRNALDALGLSEVTDTTAGLSITIPANLVTFDSYETPFARYKAKSGSGVEVLLISQYGDIDTLFGLYEIMQTLEIVPPDGERSKGNDSFTLTGQGPRTHSYTYARHVDGTIKGFTLAYPSRKAAEMARIIPMMQESLTPLEGALDPSYSDEDAQSIDLLAGLELRQPERTASGFYVHPRGQVLTSASAVASCERVTIDNIHNAQVTASNDQFALLTPDESLVPLNYARFSESVGRLRSAIAVSGYSYGGTLDEATLTYGTLEDIRGLNGEEGIKRLGIDTLPGDAGGPILTGGAAVSGMLLPPPETGRVLPDHVQFGADASAIRDFLANAELDSETVRNARDVAPEDLSRIARDITVLIGCW